MKPQVSLALADYLPFQTMVNYVFVWNIRYIVRSERECGLIKPLGTVTAHLSKLTLLINNLEHLASYGSYDTNLAYSTLYCSTVKYSGQLGYSFVVTSTAMSWYWGFSTHTEYCIESSSNTIKEWGLSWSDLQYPSQYYGLVIISTVTASCASSFMTQTSIIYFPATSFDIIP